MITLYKTLTNYDGVVINRTCSHRIVVYGDDMVNAVDLKSAKPFNFQEAYKLKTEDVNKNNLSF